VISKTFFNSSAFLVTTARLPAPACICSNVNGTLEAKLTKPSNAF
jgi:hypothetical protein